MWTSRNRARYDRSKLRYPSDVTDEEWELIGPQIKIVVDGGFSAAGLSGLRATDSRWTERT